MAVNGNHPKLRPSRKGCKCFHCIGYMAEGREHFKGAAKMNVATRRAVESAKAELGSVDDALAEIRWRPGDDDECGAKPPDDDIEELAGYWHWAGAADN